MEFEKYSPGEDEELYTGLEDSAEWSLIEAALLRNVHSFY
jgi:hypothetical protein